MWWWSLAWGSPGVVPVTTAGSITVDGVLDEPVWTVEREVPVFTRYQPTEGGPPPGRTDVRFAQDEKFLYVAVRVTDTPYPIRAHVTPRESINADDQVGIYLDTFQDGISGYIFYFNALGIQQDIRHNAGNWNVAWDTLLFSEGHVTEDGYELEIAFPWRSLKFPSDRDQQTWGVLVTRKIPGEGAKYGWPYQERGTPRIFAKANHLVGVRPPKRGSGLELLPSITMANTWPNEQPPGVLDVVRPSLDARFGITPDIGVAATINPDFSQVESDVSDVRLNARFAFAFPERRPFFLDGVDSFADTSSTLYTRSMNEPLYGLKVSGREGNLNVGLMHVLDANPIQSFNERSAPGFGEQDVEDALASSSLLRARVNAFGGGFIGVTAGDKRLVGGSGRYQVAGFDMDVPLGNRWVGRVAQTHSLTSDGDESLWGGLHIAQIQRASGVGTGIDLAFARADPGYRQELGFLTQSDRTDVSLSADHTFTPNGIIDTVRPLAWWESKNEGNGDAFAQLGTGVQTQINGVHSIRVDGWWLRYKESGVDVQGFGTGLRADSNLGAAADLTVGGFVGREIDFQSLAPALAGNAQLTLDLRPTAGIQTSTRVQMNVFESVGQTSTTQLIRNRFNAQVSKRTGVRWILDYSDGTNRDPRLFNALLLTWLRNPGTAFWAGGSVAQGPDGKATEGTVFVKASLLLRP